MAELYQRKQGFQSIPQNIISNLRNLQVLEVERFSNKVAALKSGHLTPKICSDMSNCFQDNSVLKFTVFDLFLQSFALLMLYSVQGGLLQII